MGYIVFYTISESVKLYLSQNKLFDINLATVLPNLVTASQSIRPISHCQTAPRVQYSVEAVFVQVAHSFP